MAKIQTYQVTVTRIMSRAQDETVRQLDIQALNLQGAIKKALADEDVKPWLDSSIGQIDITAFCVER